MSRYRDTTIRSISSKISEKLEKKNNKTPPPLPTHTHTNLSKIHVGKIIRGETSKETIETIAKGTKSKATIYV
jgi:hypothetical protein